MNTQRLRLPAFGLREILLSAGAAVLTAIVSLVASQKLGTVGLIVPLALVLAGILLLRPVLTMSLVVGLVILCEGPTFGLFTFAQHLYTQLYRDVTLLDAMVALAVAAVAVDIVRDRRALHWPRALMVPLVLLALGMVVGVVVGHAAGASLRFAITSEHVLIYLLLVPVAIANLDIDRRRVTAILGGLAGLAVIKALLGLAEIAGHKGAAIEGASTLTYYEPTANWLLLAAILTVAAAALARARAPRWVLLASPLLVACLLLSYRRSFWIAAVLGLLLVLLLGTSAVGRRMLVPAGLGVAVAIWLLGSLNFQGQLPIIKRVSSLNPTKLEANREDRYRLDERANVIAEIRRHPISGLGMTIPWAASAQPLSLEGAGGEGRQYVHFALLYFWLKLGVLGLLAYIGVVVASMVLGFQIWRRSREPLLRAYGLASLCSMAGLVAIETTATFTGVDPRFTLLLATQIGLLALLARTSGETQDVAAAEPLRVRWWRPRRVSRPPRPA